MITIFIFGFFSILFLKYSWNSLRSFRHHGFYRFFAFEGILILVLLNADYWFQGPFSMRQILSWLLLVTSIALAVHGFYLLHTVGKPRQNFEDTTELVKSGRLPFHSSSPLCVTACRCLGRFAQTYLNFQRGASFVGQCISICYGESRRKGESGKIWRCLSRLYEE